MNPTFLDDMSWEMAEVYGAITDQILINLARHLPFYVADNVPTSAFTYQAQMLAQMGKINRETVRIIRNNLDGVDDTLKAVLEQSIIDAVRTAEPELYEAAKAGILQPAGIPIVAPNQMRAFNLYYQQAAEKLNLVNTVMLESTKSAYQQAVSDVVSEIELADRLNRTQLAIDTATGEVVTGVSSWNTAVRHATQRMADGGIVGFIDHGGHRWSAEAYTAMDIRTTVFNTARSAVWETNQNFGNDLYSVSYHNGARPLCYPWQNKVISSTDAARTVTDLDGNTIEVIAQSATSYGEAAGLFGINCKHYPTPFIPGVSLIRGKPQNEEDNARTYEESQEQRRLERKLREQKRDVMMAKAQGRPQEEIDRLQDKAKATSEEIDDFCTSTGRHRRRNREGVYTKRDFPDADKYDVTAFEHEQQNRIREFYQSGGAQQGYTFGQMTPNEPITNAPTMPTPGATANPDVLTFNPAKTREEAETYARDHFGTKYSTMSYKGIDVEYANTCNRVLTEVNEKFDLEANAKYPKLKSIEPMNMRSNLFRGSTSEAAYRWSGDGSLFINPTYYKSAKAFAAHKREIDELTQTCLNGGQKLLDSGKYTGKQRTYLETLLRTKRQCVSQSYDFAEGTFVHESGHMLEDKIFGKTLRGMFGEGYGKTGSLKVDEYLFESRMKYGVNISGYAVTDNREYIAESFTAWWYGEKDILDPTLVQMFESAVKQ